MQDEGKGRVLVVDDDQLVLETLSTLLTGCGYSVRCCRSGGEALRAFTESPADVVITDVNMPGISGFRLLEMIRDIDRGTPVILITGNAESELAMEADRLQASAFIAKPFAPDKLIEAIEHGIRSRRRRQVAESVPRE
jgi:DNA-binding NtrC family response regulator